MAFITQTNFDALKAAFAKYGVALLGAHKVELESLFHRVADNDANQIVTAIAAHVNLNGLASIAQAPIRNALTGAIPAIDNVINANIDGGFDALSNLLASFAKAA